MPAMPPIDPANPPWKARIDKVKKTAYNKGFNAGLQGQPCVTSFKDQVYVEEFNRGHAAGRARSRLL